VIAYSVIPVWLVEHMLPNLHIILLLQVGCTFPNLHLHVP